MDLEYFLQVKGRRKKKKASQKRIEESHPLSGKENYDRVGIADQLQNNSMLPFHATNKKRLVPNMLAAGAKRKIALFEKTNCAIPTVHPFHQLFYSIFYFFSAAINTSKVSLTF